MTEARHVKLGTDDHGRFAILYTSAGIRWRRGREADAYFQNPAGGPASAVASPRAKSEPFMMVDAISGFLGPAGQMISAVTSVLNWWETRQSRLFDEARFEEPRRISWTYEMLRRWVAAHESGECLDLTTSHFLAREAVATLDSVAGNPKVSVPQVLLYDLELVRSAIGSARELLGTQIRLLQTTRLPVPDGGTPESMTVPLNYEWLRRWSGDPVVDWYRAVADKNVKTFTAELRDLSRSPSEFARKAFAADDSLTVSASADLTAAQKAWIARGSAILLQAFAPTAALGITGVSMYLEHMNNKDMLRRDDFRELILLSAEVERVRLLHSVWRTIEGLIAAPSERRMLVLEESGKTQIATLDAQTLDVTALTDKAPPMLLAPAPSTLALSGGSS
jgi:hypothetical protein